METEGGSAAVTASRTMTAAHEYRQQSTGAARRMRAERMRREREAAAAGGGDAQGSPAIAAVAPEPENPVASSEKGGVRGGAPGGVSISTTAAAAEAANDSGVGSAASAVASLSASKVSLAPVPASVSRVPVQPPAAPYPSGAGSSVGDGGSVGGSSSASGGQRALRAQHQHQQRRRRRQAQQQGVQPTQGPSDASVGGSTSAPGSKAVHAPDDDGSHAPPPLEGAKSEIERVRRARQRVRGGSTELAQDGRGCRDRHRDDDSSQGHQQQQDCGRAIVQGDSSHSQSSRHSSQQTRGGTGRGRRSRSRSGTPQRPDASSSASSASASASKTREGGRKRSSSAQKYHDARGDRATRSASFAVAQSSREVRAHNAGRGRRSSDGAAAAAAAAAAIAATDHDNGEGEFPPPPPHVTHPMNGNVPSSRRADRRGQSRSEPQYQHPPHQQLFQGKQEASPHLDVGPPPPDRVWVKTRGMTCACHVWRPVFPSSESTTSSHSTTYEHPALRQSRPRAAVVIFHGLGGHSLFPTVRYLAELLRSHKYVVYGMDLPGHGRSPGPRGLIASADDLVKDGMAVTLFAKKCHPDLPIFLAGSSMGGAVALSVSHEFEVMQSGSGGSGLAGGGKDAVVSGMVLMAPMVSVSVPRWQRRLLRGLNTVMPKKALFPPAEDATGLQFRDPVRRAEVEADSLCYKGSLRVASALSCLTLTRRVHRNLDAITTPFLCLIGSEDVVVDNETARTELMELAPVPDKAFKEYEALHGLLCEKQPLRGEIEDDILDWLFERTDAGTARHGISTSALPLPPPATGHGLVGGDDAAPYAEYDDGLQGDGVTGNGLEPQRRRKGGRNSVGSCCDESVLSGLEDALFQ